jgi:ubiquinone/menaquinone biosynthesis C-methylase UbiE
MNFESHQRELDIYYRSKIGGRFVLWKDKYKPYLSLYRDRRIKRDAEIAQALPLNIEKALDLGCGQGDLLVMLAEKAQEAIGFDYCNIMVETTSENLKDFRNVKVRCAPAECLPLPDSYVDVIILADVIEHLVDPISCIRECWRVLKPGGRFIITTPNGVVERFWKCFDGAINAPFRALRKKKLRPSVHEHLYTREELQALLLTVPFLVRDHRMIEFYPGSEGGGVFGRFLRFFARQKNIREWIVEPFFRFFFKRIERLEVFNNRQFMVLDKEDE